MYIGTEVGDDPVVGERPVKSASVGVVDLTNALFCLLLCLGVSSLFVLCFC